jgi:hypothetical protein
MKSLLRIRLPLAIMALAICVTAARGQNVIANLPESDGVVAVNMRRIVNETLPRVLSAEQMSQVQAALAKAKQVAGFDVANIETAVVGLRLNRSKLMSAPSMLLVMRGSFNADALVSLLKIGLAGKSRDEKYANKTLTVLKLSDLMKGNPPSATELAVVALDSGTLAAGTTAYVKAALDPDNGKNRIKPELVQLVGREPEALIRLAALMPQGMLAGLLPQGAQGSEEIGRLVGSIEQVYVGLSMDAQAFPLSLMLKANTAENAHAIAGLLQTIAQFGANVTDKNVKPIIDALKITSEGSEVQVRTVLPQDLIGSFLRGLLSPAKPAEPKKQ